MTPAIRPYKTLLTFVSFLFFLVYAQSSLTQADDGPPTIKDFSIADRDGTLTASLFLENGITEAVKEALNSGISVQFAYTFQLIRPGWIRDKHIKTVKQTRSLTYDHLKQEYRIIFGPSTRKAVSVKDEAQAEEFALHLKDIGIVRLNTLPQGAVYILKVKASIEKEDTELPFKRLFGLFWNNTIATKWHEIRFRY